ncbi:MAG: 3-dehydroquinate synthase [Thermoleophilia bacterium]|nr:3-dehydroquinate synthase [Thermoleophilia bacterium]
MDANDGTRPRRVLRGRHDARVTTGSRASIEFDPTAPAAVRIVLVGFMGAGKTSLAERWATSGGAVLWFDSDRAVLAELGCDSVEAAFAEHGEARFREVEREVVLARAQPLARGVEVWSLGGGSLQHADVRGAISDACVVWLDAPAELLWDRVAGSDRPLARDRAAFCALHAGREELYASVSTVRVDATRPIDELGLGRLLSEYLPPSWFGSGLAVGAGLLDRVEDICALHDGPVAIVADRAVDHIADAARERLERAGHVVACDTRLPMGEFNKQLATVEGVLAQWAGAALHRGSTILAIGGGTLLDATGFAASIYQRGIDWVSVPTTLVSQVDAGIGGKTGVNLGVAKNVVGTVHMPRATLIDSTVIASLPEDAIRDGFVEAAKTAMLAGDWLLERARTAAQAGSAERGDAWLPLVEGCAGYKDAVVAEDPFDTDGIRAQLNLGHTLAHAIEAATGGAVTHGAAVAIGTHAALRLSELVLDAPASSVETWRELCAQLGIVTSSPLSWDELEPFLALDKKRDSRGLGWVLLEGVGEPVTGVRLPVEAARRVWDECIRVGEGDRPGEGAPVETASPRHPRVLVLFGVNLGQLGVRDAAHYGAQTLPELVHDVEMWAAAEGLVADCRQTDSLERFVHALHEARLRHHAVIVNPGAWTHHELAIHDALEPLSVPRVEVHLSDVDAREEWRRTSVIRPVVDHVVSGRGADGYRDALRWIATRLRG